MGFDGSAMASRHQRDGEHRRKIRDSCNTCSSQKIRCGKQRPRCARCLNKGLECNYSFSQRTGRRTPSSATTRSHPSTTEASGAPPTTPAMAESDPPVDDTMIPITPPVPSLTMHGEDAFPLDSVPDIITNAIEDADDVFRDFNSGISLDFLWSPAAENSANCSAPTNGIGLAGSLQTIGTLTPYSQVNSKWQNTQTTPPSNLPELSKSSTSPDFGQEPRPVISRRASQPYHHGQDCLALALQVIYDLHVFKEHCTTSVSDQMTYMQTTREEPRDVDAVLFLNRDAIKSVNKILGCACCSGNQSVTLACYLACSKIIEWYGAAIGIDLDGYGNDSNNASHDEHPEDQALLSAMSNRIISRPIFMGRYCLDAEVHLSVRAKVVLSELREHMQPLIGRLPRYHVSSPNVKGSKHHNSSLSPSQHKDVDGQFCTLRNQVRKIIREASNINKHT